MNRLFSVLLLVSMCFSLACSSGGEAVKELSPLNFNIQTVELITPDAPGDAWKTYTNQIYNYTIQYPAYWKVDDILPARVSFATSGSMTQFVIAIDAGVASMSSVSYAAMWREAGRESKPQHKQVSDTDVLLADYIKAYMVVETWSEPSGDYEERGKGVFFVNGDTGFRLYAKCRTDAYEKYGDMFDYMISSFAVIGDPSENQEWKTYTNEEFKYTLDLPDKWVVTGKSDDGSMEITGPSKSSFISVKVSSIDEMEAPTFESWVDSMIISDWEDGYAYELLVYEDSQIESIVSCDVAFIIKEAEYAPKTQNHSKYVMSISGPWLYEISCVSAHSVMGLYSSTFERIMDGFTLTEKNPWFTHTDKVYYTSIDYPGTMYVADEERSGGEQCFAILPLEFYKEELRGSMGVSVCISDLVIDVNFRNEVDEIVDSLEYECSDFEIVSDGTMTYRNKAAREIDCEIQYYGSDVPIYCKLLFIRGDWRIYTIMAHAEELYYNSYSETFDRMIESFVPSSK